MPLAFDAGIHSKDVWRGWLYSDEPVYQHYVSIGVGRFALSLFSCRDLHGGRGWTEHDYTLSYGAKKGSLLWEVSCVFYDTSEADSDSWELCAKAELADSLWRPSLAVCHDVGKGQGTYIELSADGNLPGIFRPGINVSASVGCNLHQWRERSGFSHLMLRAELPRRIGGSGWTLVPAITFWKSLDRGDFSDHLVFGISVRS